MITDPHLEEPIHIVEIICLIGLFGFLIFGAIRLRMWCDEQDRADAVTAITEKA